MVFTLNKHASLKKRSKREKKMSDKPWITKGILISSKTKTTLHKTSVKGSDEDVQKYKTFRNRLSHINEQSKRIYYRKIVNDTRHNMRLLWKTINDIAKYKRKSNIYIGALKDECDQTISDLAKMTIC